MSLQEVAKDLNDAYKTEKEKTLEKRIDELENILVNLSKRLEYLESHQ